MGIRHATVAWGDYNNDGNLDMLWGNANSQSNSVYKNNGNGAFTYIWASPEGEKTQAMRRYLFAPSQGCGNRGGLLAGSTSQSRVLCLTRSTETNDTQPDAPLTAGDSCVSAELLFNHSWSAADSPLGFQTLDEKHNCTRAFWAADASPPHNGVRQDVH